MMFGRLLIEKKLTEMIGKENLAMLRSEVSSWAMENGLRVGIVHARRVGKARWHHVYVNTVSMVWTSDIEDPRAVSWCRICGNILIFLIFLSVSLAKIKSPLQPTLLLPSSSSMWVPVCRYASMRMSVGVWALFHPCGIMAFLTPTVNKNMACIICPPHEINCTSKIGSTLTLSQALSESGWFFWLWCFQRRKALQCVTPASNANGMVEPRQENW